MRDAPSKKSEFVFTKQALDKLLLLLDSDRETAGVKYEQIREKLIQFFAWRLCVCPEDLADRTIDRTVAKIYQGEIIHNPNKYVFQVAQYVLLEYKREPNPISITSDNLSIERRPPEGNDSLEEQQQPDRTFACLERCLQKLDDAKRELIERYYSGENPNKAENKTRLAEQLGISVDALYLQIWRIKKELSACILECLKRVT